MHTTLTITSPPRPPGRHCEQRQCLHSFLVQAASCSSSAFQFQRPSQAREGGREQGTGDSGREGSEGTATTPTTEKWPLGRVTWTSIASEWSSSGLGVESTCEVRKQTLSPRVLTNTRSSHSPGFRVTWESQFTGSNLRVLGMCRVAALGSASGCGLTAAVGNPLIILFLSNTVLLASTSYWYIYTTSSDTIQCLQLWCWTILTTVFLNDKFLLAFLKIKFCFR